MLKRDINSNMCLDPFAGVKRLYGIELMQQHKSLETCKTLVPNLFLALFCFPFTLCCVWYDCGLLCFASFHCAMQNQGQAEEDDKDQEKDDERFDTDEEGKSPEKQPDKAKTEIKEEGSIDTEVKQEGGSKTEVKKEGGSDNDDDDAESKIQETKEASEIKPLEGKTVVKVEAESSSERDSCKVEGAVSVSSSNAIDNNKENETKGDAK